MSPNSEPIEPDYVIDSTARTPVERARRVASRAYHAADAGVRTVRRAASGSQLISSTESTVNRALDAAAHAIDDAVRSGKVERAFDRAQKTVSSGADGVRRLAVRHTK